MVKSIKLKNLSEVKQLLNSAMQSYSDIGIHDMRGSIADAKSILGLLSLDYSQPVKVVCENEHELKRVCRAVAQ